MSNISTMGGNVTDLALEMSKFIGESLSHPERIFTNGQTFAEICTALADDWLTEFDMIVNFQLCNWQLPPGSSCDCDNATAVAMHTPNNITEDMELFKNFGFRENSVIFYWHLPKQYAVSDYKIAFFFFPYIRHCQIYVVFIADL